MQEVYEVRRAGYRTVQEFWEPKLEDLDTLLVTRQIPTLHILLSKVTPLFDFSCYSML
jgi:ribonuclease P/MRP protein subunit RPP25